MRLSNRGVTSGCCGDTSFDSRAVGARKLREDYIRSDIGSRESVGSYKTDRENTESLEEAQALSKEDEKKNASSWTRKSLAQTSCIA